MPKPRDFIPKSLSAKIILQTVFAIALLMIPAILAMVIGTRIITREEVGRQIDQALDGIACRIDNTFLSVEQTAAMIQGDIPGCLDNPQGLYNLCRNVLEANPSIDGCAIALNPEKYTFRGKPFMAYIHRANGEIISSESFTSLPFTEQEWFVKPLQESVARWVGPLKNEKTETEPLISYDVPIVKDNSTVAVLGIDMSLSVLTQIVQNYKTSTHSYITLLDRDGSYIVHPDSNRIRHMDSMAQLNDVENPPVIKALQEMVGGKSQVSNLGWSIAVIYPEYDLFADFDPGYRLATVLIIVGLILLFAGAIAIPRIRLKPLKELVDVTQVISEGNYNLSGFETSRTDEVGRLQSQYGKMLHSVSDYMEQLQNLSQKEAAQQDELARIYARTKEVQKRKAAFFGNMTHHMVDVTAEIQSGVDKLCEFGAGMGEQETKKILDSIEKNGQRVTEILNDMLNTKSRDDRG